MKDYVQYLNLNKSHIWPEYFKSALWSFHDIHYEDLELDYDNFKVNFDGKKQEVEIDFPLFTKFVAEGRFELHHFLGLFGIDSPMQIRINDMEMKCRIGEKVGASGYPLFYAPEFSFDIGHSWVNINNHLAFSEFINEFLRIFNVLASQATKWFGMGVVDLAIDNLMKASTHNYNLPFIHWVEETPYPFGIDIRQTKNAIIDDDSIEFYFLGDVSYNFNTANLKLPDAGIEHNFAKKRDSAQLILAEHWF